MILQKKVLFNFFKLIHLIINIFIIFHIKHLKNNIQVRKEILMKKIKSILLEHNESFIFSKQS